MLNNRVIIFISIVLILGFNSAIAEEFSLNDPNVELRQIQFCIHCGNPMIVNNIDEDAPIRCPFCNKTQLKIKDNLLKSYVLQLCPGCQNAFSVYPKKEGEMTECPLCKMQQKVFGPATLTPAGAKDFDTAEKAKPAMHVHVLQKNNKQHIMSPIYSKGNYETSKDSIYIPPVSERNFGKDSIPQQIDDSEIRQGMIPEIPRELFQRGISNAPHTDQKSSGKTSADMPEKNNDPDKQEDYLKNSEADYKVSASVNGEAISAHDFELRLSYELDNERRKMGESVNSIQGRETLIRKLPEIKKRILDELIHEKLVLQKAKETGIEVKVAELEREAKLIAAQENFGKITPEIFKLARKNILMKKMLDMYVPEEPPSPAEIKEYYQQNKNRYISAEKVNINVITIFKNRSGRIDSRSASSIIAKAQREISNGADFRSIAAKYSEDTFSESGGQFQAGMATIVPVQILAVPVQNAIHQKPQGYISEPLDLINAMVIIRLNTKSGGIPLSLEKVQNEIKYILTRKKRIRNIEQFLETLRKNAVININQ